MEYIIGILLLISFVGLAVYAVRGGNLMMGMLIMAIIWKVLPLIGNTCATNPEFIGSYPGITDISVVDAITKVFQSGPEGAIVSEFSTPSHDELDIFTDPRIDRMPVVED